MLATYWWDPDHFGRRRLIVCGSLLHILASWAAWRAPVSWSCKLVVMVMMHVEITMIVMVGMGLKLRRSSILILRTTGVSWYQGWFLVAAFTLSSQSSMSWSRSQHQAFLSCASVVYKICTDCFQRLFQCMFKGQALEGFGLFYFTSQIICSSPIYVGHLRSQPQELTEHSVVLWWCWVR